jgi:CheY-like chemotaxis protein
VDSAPITPNGYRARALHPRRPVLIADADPRTRTRYQRFFRALGCDVVEAADGHKALLHALVRPPMLVVADLELPLLDGAALCEVLRRDRTTTHVPVLIAAADPEARERARRAGATAVFDKTSEIGAALAESRRLVTAGAALRARSQLLARMIAEQRRRSAILWARSTRARRAAAVAGARPGNLILAALPDTDFARLAPDLRAMSVRARQVLRQPGDRLESVYFPNDGLCSVASVLANGTTVEIAAVGAEGMVGIEAVLGGAAGIGETAVRTADIGVTVLPVTALARELARHGALYRLLACYTRFRIAEMTQSAACNAVHTVRQRAARLLLTTQDRASGNDLPLSHEHLGVLLAVRRSTISGIAAGFQRDGLVTYRRGRIRIADRAGLEAAACECYATVRAEYDRLPLLFEAAGTVSE